MAMLEPAQIGGRRPVPEILLERTWPDAPSAQITAVGARAKAAPRLVVTAGPRKGTEFALLDPLTTLGRAAGSGVAIADLSVSRRHSRLEKKGARWVLFDEGSGNGTGVNGRSVARRTLRHGDELALGDTRLRFLEAEGVIAWSDVASGAPGSLRSWVAALLAIALVAGIAAVRQQGEQDRAQAEVRSLALREAALAYLRESEALGKRGRLAEARDRLRAAAELDPGDPGIARALRTAEEAAAGAAPPHPAVPLPAAPDRPRGGAAQPIVEAYLSGQVALALRRARAAQGAAAGPLVALLQRFDGSWRAAVAEREPALALRRLEEAADADRALSGGRSSRPGRKLARAIALRHLQLAAGLQGDDALPQAAAHLRAALRSDPGNAGARAGLRRLADRSREIYLRAYLSKDGDPAPARRMFALVAEALPDGDETGAKARRWLARLEGKANP